MESKNHGQLREWRNSLTCFVIVRSHGKKTEPAIVAFRNRVAELWMAEVTQEDAVKGDKESNGRIKNTVMLIRGIIGTSNQVPLREQDVTLKAAHKNHSATKHRFCRGLWSMQGASCPHVKKDRDQKTSFERLHGKKPSHVVRKCWQSKSPLMP